MNAAAAASAAALSKPPALVNIKPGQSPQGKTFVICEICDGYIKDLDQLRNHMQWMHKVKVNIFERNQKLANNLGQINNVRLVVLFLIDSPEDDLQSAPIELSKMSISIFH